VTSIVGAGLFIDPPLCEACDLHVVPPMSRLRLALTLLGVCSLALGLIGPASARTDTGPRYGGTLVVRLPADLGTLDPVLSNGLAVYSATCVQLYDDHSKQLIPVLAAALPVLSKDKLNYTIQLRRGVMFNDGTPFNAQAVVTNYQYYTTTPGSIHASDFASVASVSAIGPYTIVYHLNARNSTFTGNMYVLSPTQLAKLGGDFGTDPVCVGPFMIDHRVIGDNITAIKSPYYYDQKDVYLDKIVWKVIPDASAALEALQAGDIQETGIDPTQLPAIQQNPNVRVLQMPTLGWTGIVINIGNKNGVGQPFTNVGTPLATSATLRQAFEEAIDRNALNRVVFDGLNQPSCTMIPPSNTLWFDATKVPCTPYNPKDARKLVAASGFTNPTVHLLTGIVNPTTDLRVAQFIQAQEAAVGINVSIDTADRPTGGALLASGSFDATGPRGRTPGGVDPDGMLNPFLASSGATNWSGYSNPRLDLILANGLKATDTKARATLYHAAQQIIENDRPVIVLYNPVTIAAVSTNVTGIQVTPGGLVTIANARFK
jgi:peptide/nickel transport system substrate-binding protein